MKQGMRWKLKLPNMDSFLRKIVEGVSYGNAKRYFEL